MSKKEKKSNKLRNYLLGATALGLTGAGAYKLLRKNGAKLITNSPVTSLGEKNISGIVKANQSSDLVQITSNVKSELTSNSKSKLQKFLRKSRKKSNLKSAQKLRGKRKIYQREFDRMQKMSASIDNSKPQGLLPPAKGEIFDNSPQIKDVPKIDKSQKLLTSGRKIPKGALQRKTITIANPFWKTSKSGKRFLVKGYQRNILTDLSQQMKRTVRDVQSSQINTKLNNESFTNNLLDKSTVKNNIDNLREYLKSARIKSDVNLGNVRPWRIKPNNPVEIVLRQLAESPNADILIRQDFDQAMNLAKNKAVHIKNVVDDIDTISQQQRETIRKTRDFRIKKRIQVENQPFQQQNILDALNSQIEKAKQFAIDLDTSTKSRLNFRKSVEKTYDEISKEINTLNVPTLSRKLDTVKTDVKLQQFKRELDETLSNPFATDDYFDKVGEIKDLSNQIDNDITWTQFQLKEPTKRAKKINDGLKRIRDLRTKYNKTLEEVTKNNKSKIEQNNLILDNLIDEFSKLDIDDVGEQFYKTDLKSTIDSLRKLRSGESVNYVSPYLTKINLYEQRLLDLQTEFNKRMSSQEYGELNNYLNELKRQKREITSLPKNKLQLNKEQRVKFDEVEKSKLQFKNTVKEFDTIQAEYKTWRNNFNKELETVEKNIRDYTKDVENGEMLNYHLDNLNKKLTRANETFNKSKQQALTLDKLIDPKTYNDYFDNQLLNKAPNERITLSQMMTAKREAIMGKTRSIDNSFKQERSKFDELLGAKNYSGVLDKFKAYTSEANYVKTINLRQNVIEKEIDKLQDLRKQYTKTQSDLLLKLKNQYDEIVKVNPQYKEFLDAKLKTIQNNIKADSDANLKFINASKLQAEDSLLILDEIKSIKPEIKLVKRKVENITSEGLTTYKPKTNLDDIYNYDLETSIAGTYKKLGVKNKSKLKVDESGKNYTQTVYLNRGKTQFELKSNKGDITVNEWIDQLKNRIQSYKGKNDTDVNIRNRTIISDLYWDMQRNNILTEGKGNIFEQIRNGKLGEREQKYIDIISKGHKDVLYNFSQQGIEKSLEQFYYKNTIRKYLLTLETPNRKWLPSFVQNQMENNDKWRTVDKITNIFEKKVGIYSGNNNRHLGMIGRKSNEVRDLVDEINRLLSNYNTSVPTNTTTTLVKQADNLPTNEFKPLKLVNYMRNGDEYLSLNGRLTVENLPSLFANTSSQYKNLNTLLRKLHAKLGVNEMGLPIVNDTLVNEISGKKVDSFAKLEQLIKKLNGEMYEKASLNTLLTANRVNYDEVKNAHADLYLYNFALNKDNITTF